MDTRKKTIVNCFVLIAILSFFTMMVQACSAPKHVKKVNFVLIADKKANEERSVYIVIRKINKKVFLNESYEDVTDTIYAEPRDQNLLAWRILIPGREEKLSVEIIKPDEVTIGVYGLFTNPGKNWKLLFETPLESKYSIKIKENNLECKNIVSD